MEPFLDHPSELFQALADPLRFRLMRVLAGSGIQESCSCDLAEALEEAEYAISRHLKLLRAVGLLSAEKEGRWVYHRIRRSSLVHKYLVAAVLEVSDRTGEFARDHQRLLTLVRKRSGARCEGRISTAPKHTKERIA